MRLERRNLPTRREAWIRMGQICSAAALWSSDLPRHHFPPMDSGPTTAWAVPLVSADSDEFALVTQFGKSRIGAAPDGSLLRQRPLTQPIPKEAGWIVSTQQPVYFPQFLFGAWNVTATLRQQFQIPPCADFGASFKTEESVTMDRRRSDNTYQIQFFATLANTWKNQWAVNLGTGIPETKVIPNRAYNLPTELQWIGWDSQTISDVQWDYRNTAAPSRVSWENADHQRYERDVMECLSEGGDEGVFAVTERHRIQALASNGKPMKVDMETTTEYHQISSNHVQALSRIVVFPSTLLASRLQSSVCPTSMTVLNYELSMLRLVQPFQNILTDAVEERPCVETPKGIVQCY